MKHIPVFKEKIIDNLQIDSNGVYFDATLGAGGHASSILENLSENGKLLVSDVDPIAIQHFKESHESEVAAGQVLLFQTNFSQVAEQVKSALGEISLDGIIADLGWSTDQLEHIPGLSFMQPEAVLDMRLDPSLGVTAADILNSYSDKELTSALIELADSDRKEAKYIVDAVISTRKVKEFRIVEDLNQVLETIKPKLRRQHNLEKRIYQTLRIIVNQEYEALNSLIESGIDLLKVNGKMLIITFHSGEENIVHKKLKQETEIGRVDWIWEQTPYLQPEVAELRRNFQSHSAKLWGVTKN